MKSLLLNFGTNVRVVGDVDGINHAIGIGQSATVDLHEAHEKLIRRGMALGEALIILPEGAEAPVELAAIAALLANISGADYDMLVEAYHKVAPMDGADIRPDRNTMRSNLEKLGLMLSKNQKLPTPGVFIREEQTPDTPKQPEQKPETKRETKDSITTESINEALGLGTEPFKTVPAVAKEEGSDVIDLPDSTAGTTPVKAPKSKKPRAPRKAKERAAA